MRPLSLAIVGIDFPNKRGPARRFELEICLPGEPIELRPEPKNEFDEHAIAVFSTREVQVGYLASERAVYIGTLWRQGHQTTAIFQGLAEKVGWIRVAFDGDEPVLPEDTYHPPAIGEPVRYDSASGFFADPTYDDDR